MTDVRNRRRARATAIALQAEDARQALIRRALLAVTGGLIAAVAVAALAMRGIGF
ncbi:MULTISPECIES: hypothetical protein [unclassified Ancylobacter]|jgi:hypothetical protein|uniref:hypothetical protein n=1 Tax=unclassified Ancylobacter TaxID=2626613 RepID=UPI00227093A3|nr:MULTISPECIES: hypothetical protein [unclassified Ancylobacter]WAC26367.1 hypothetical protein OU996_15280 [Ancylobacter sp. SL191]WGD31259.1 hypothetical protein AncyloWKF20_05390 [Ancylobacter sp. WKF20]